MRLKKQEVSAVTEEDGGDGQEETTKNDSEGQDNQAEEDDSGEQEETTEDDTNKQEQTTDEEQEQEDQQVSDSDADSQTASSDTSDPDTNESNPLGLSILLIAGVGGFAGIGITGLGVALVPVAAVAKVVDPQYLNISFKNAFLVVGIGVSLLIVSGIVGFLASLFT